MLHTCMELFTNIYRLHLDHKYSFEEALYACQAEDSNLLEIRSRREYVKVMERIKGFNVWLGIKVSQGNISIRT